MALSDFVPARRPIVVNGEALFSVEGISLETLATLVSTHLPDLEAVFDILVRGETADEPFVAHLQRVSQGIALQAPGLAANIIAIASTEELTPALVANAKRLPFPVQVDAMMQIGALTFDEAGGVKKSVESLMILLARLRTKPLQGMEETETPSPSSSATTTGSVET